MNPYRRAFLGTACAAGLAGLGQGASWAAQTQSLVDPFRLAVDDALAESGLASTLQKAFGRDTGVAVKVLHGPASDVLEAIERGEHDAAITNAPQLEAALERQGLVHDYKAVAHSRFVLVGPAAFAKPLAAGSDTALGLARIAQAQVPFMAKADGSGTHLMEQAAWRAARIAPAGAWYAAAKAGAGLLDQARQAQACTLVDEGVWLAQRVPGYAVLSGSDPRMAVDLHLMRAFRAPRQHPAGKLFISWLTGPKGHRAVASHRGYSTASTTA